MRYSASLRLATQSSIKVQTASKFTSTKVLWSSGWSGFVSGWDWKKYKRKDFYGKSTSHASATAHSQLVHKCCLVCDLLCVSSKEINHGLIQESTVSALWNSIIASFLITNSYSSFVQELRIKTGNWTVRWDEINEVK